MNIKNDTEETKKLKELFYTAEKENIELAFTVAQSTDNQQFLDFYQQWEQIYSFYQKYHVWGWTHFNHLSDLLSVVQKHGLQLSNLGIETLPDYFVVAGKVCKSINLNLNNLFKIPEVVQHFSQLKQLSLDITCLQMLPDWLFEFKNLEGLYLEANFINYLTPNIQFLSNLVRFDFVQNRVCELPATFASLQKLVHLKYGTKIKNAEIMAFPTPILACQKLQSLILQNLYLQEIPAQIADLVHLEELHIFDCEIENPTFEFKSLAKLRFLSLSGQHIKTIPDSVLACEQLTELGLSNTQIDKIPVEISRLRNLQKLYLQNTLIDSNSIEFWESQLRRWLPQTEVEWGFF